jgi:hypothetical protein
MLSDSANKVGLKSPLYGDLCAIVFSPSFGTFVNFFIAVENVK